MSKDKLTALRERNYTLAGLPDLVRVPTFPGGRGETTRPIETVTLDDIAFALIALQEKASAIYREADALRTVYELARRNGALGSDPALCAIPVEKEGS